MFRAWFGRKKKHSRRGPIRERFVVGRDTYGEPRVYDWGEGATLRIGSFCSIAADVSIFLGGEHRMDWATTFPFMRFRASARRTADHPVTKGDVVIGHDVWIAHGATILSGVTIGNGAVVGARAVVARDVPPYGIVAGNPGKLIRKRFDEATIADLQRIAWWDWPDALLDEAMPLLLSSDIPGLVRFADERRLDTLTTHHSPVT